MENPTFLLACRLVDMGEVKGESAEALCEGDYVYDVGVRRDGGPQGGREDEMADVVHSMDSTPSLVR